MLFVQVKHNKAVSNKRYFKVKEKEIRVLNVPFYVNDEKFDYALYGTSDYLNVNDTEFYVEEDVLDFGTILTFFEDELIKDEDVLYICTMDKRTQSFENLQQAIEILKNKYMNKFMVVYVPTNSFAIKSLIDDVIEKIENKIPIDIIKKDIEKNLASYKSLILLEDKKIITRYYQRPTQSLSFGIKPIFVSALSGSMELLSKQDGMTNGINEILNILDCIKTDNKVLKISIQYAKSRKHAELLESLIMKKYGDDIRVDKVFMDPYTIKEFGIGAISVSFKGEI